MTQVHLSTCLAQMNLLKQELCMPNVATAIVKIFYVHSSFPYLNYLQFLSNSDGPKIQQSLHSSIYNCTIHRSNRQTDGRYVHNINASYELNALGFDNI